jgi:putative phosphoesterase
MIIIGVLSDTHLIEPDAWFRKKAKQCFAKADIIFHAGDLTSLSVLDVFAGKTVHAVHGNMCGPKTRTTLPASKIVEIGGFRFAMVHGAGFMHNIEDKLYDVFGLIDCIIYGHTHKPVCHLYGTTLMVNPGSFSATGPYGASGTYAIIKVNHQGMDGKIYSVGDAQ